jgi:periplasmic divalent cation tolerance protein
MPKTDVVLVMVTAPEAEADPLARTLVDEALCACVNLVPRVRSIYRWQGKVDAADEVLCLMKTTRARLPALTARIVSLHSYDVPEVLALSIEEGHAAYLDWVAASSGGASAAPAPKNP